MMYTFRMVLMALFATLFLVAASCDDQTVGDEEPTDGSVGEVVEGDAANDATAGDAATDTESTDGSVDSNVLDAEVSTEDAEASDTATAGDAEAATDAEATTDGESFTDAEAVDAVMPEDDAAVTVDAEETEED